MSNEGPDRRWFEGQRDFVYRRVFVTAQNFIRIEAASGIVLLAATVVALVWANSPLSDSYFDFWHTHLDVRIAFIDIDLDLQDWVNDALMTLFFFLAGLEIKRELVHGELSSPRRAVLPAVAALGGMVLPALIFFAVAGGSDGAEGWGIPMATDIAFAVGVLALLARRIPPSIRVFLLALAIADDIGAIIVIAVFYSGGVDIAALGVAVLAAVAVLGANRLGVHGYLVYAVVGAIMWLALFEAGVHPTLAGVVLGLMTPAGHRPTSIDAVTSEEAPLEQLEQALVTWVSFLIVPLFALANAGVHIDGDTVEAALESPLALGVAIGLVVGKPLGIFMFTWIAVQLKLCDKPVGASWAQIFGVGMIAGIGFTISLLIASLAFEEQALVDEAKLGVLAGSTVAGIAGLIFLFFASRPSTSEPLLVE